MKLYGATLKKSNYQNCEVIILIHCFFPLNDRDTCDSAENGHYQSLKAEERYEHVYQGLLPTTNR